MTSLDNNKTTPKADEQDISLYTVQPIDSDNKPADASKNQEELPKDPSDIEEDKSKEGSSASSNDEPKETETFDTDENKTAVKSLIVGLNNENLNEEDKALRTELLERFKGKDFDEEGNIIDENNKVVATFEDVFKFTIEDTEERYDKDGNLINEEGKIIKTKEEVLADKSVANKISKELGLQVKDEQGKPKVYSDDINGFKEMAIDYSNILFRQHIDNFFAQNEELANISKHILSGKSLETYNTSVDYSKIDKTKLSDDQMIGYIRKDLEIKQFNKDRIESTIQRIKDSKDIEAEFDASIESLTAYEKLVNDQRDADYEKTRQKQQDDIIKYWDNVKSVVNKGEISEITIPEADREPFFNYMAVPVDNNGNSQAMVDASKESIETQLTFDYLRYKGYDLSALVNSKAQEKRIDSLKERIKKGAKLSKATVQSTSGKTDKATDDMISISNLLS